MTHKSSSGQTPPAPHLNAHADAPLPRAISRRSILQGGLGLGAAAGFSTLACQPKEAATVIARASGYDDNLRDILTRSLAELGITEGLVKGLRILFKPNLVETSLGQTHINTHPLMVRAAAETFLSLGAKSVIVAEGPGHRRDSILVLDESGMADVLDEDNIPFVDLNFQRGLAIPNAGKQTSLPELVFPSALSEVDWIVSMPKLKTHHWVGVTLSMKNLFGVMPSFYYGWPKNVLHQQGIENSIIDINATLMPQLAIVDGIVGMDGDGPIMGNPRDVGAIVVGTNFPAVDATCTRLMGLDPRKIDYLQQAAGWLGPIAANQIEQRGERIASLAQSFALVEGIPMFDYMLS